MFYVLLRHFGIVLLLNLTLGVSRPRDIFSLFWVDSELNSKPKVSGSVFKEKLMRFWQTTTGNRWPGYNCFNPHHNSCSDQNRRASFSKDLLYDMRSFF